MSPAGLQAGDRDTVSGLWRVREVRQAAAPVLHPPDGTVLQPCHDVSDGQTPRTVGRRALVQTHSQERHTSFMREGSGDTSSIFIPINKGKENLITALMTCTTSMTRAPPPVEYMGRRKIGNRKRKANAATHRTKLCQTPVEQK